MEFNRTVSVYPFLIVGIVAGTLLALLVSSVSLFPFGFFPLAKNTLPHAFTHTLFYFWTGFYALMFLLAYPHKQSLTKILFVTLIPSFIASLPFYWQSYYTVSQLELILFSAYALNAFHINYQTNGFHLSYQTLFYAVWDTFIKILIALFFAILCWTILFLCRELFSLVGIQLFKQLISHRWFNVWVTSLFISIGLYIATQTNTVVHNIRIVFVLMCQYLLIPLAIIGILFILAFLISTYQTHLPTHGKSLFFPIALLCVLFLNGLYQDGSSEKLYPNFLLWICRIFLWITPIFSLLALYAIYTQGYNSIQVNGFNTKNFSDFLNTFLLLIYNITYAVIAMRRGKQWLKPIEYANVVLAIVLIGVTLFTTNQAFIKHFPQPIMQKIGLNFPQPATQGFHIKT